MRILVATPDFSPVQKFGGVGDGVAALARALCRMGHHLTVVLPFSSTVPNGFAPAPPLALTKDLLVDRFVSSLAPGLEVVLLSPPGVPPGRGAYGSDFDLIDARRFALYCRAVVVLAAERALAGEPFDVVHAHEWPTAPIPYLLREAGTPRPRTVLTLHNIVHQGIFAPEALGWLGLGPEHLRAEALGLEGRVDFLKAGIVAADALTTVSQTYAREILAPLSERLEDALRVRSTDLVGIINGVDTELWSPVSDPALPAHFRPEDTRGKAACKQVWCAAHGFDPARPLVISLGRLVEQKGVDLLVQALPAILSTGASVAIAGGGGPRLESMVAAAVEPFPGRAARLGRISDDAAHQLFAAADLLVMPSRFEPCGIVQLEARRYGTLPVARRTGGLADTITDASADLTTGSGFLFDEASGPALAAGVARAVSAMALPGWEAFREMAMRLPVSWNGPARRYDAVYRGRTR